MNDNYILEGHEAVPTDLMTWARWIEKSENKRVTEDELPDGRWVSTVFLGLDHSFGDGPPLLFETMVFPSKGEWGETYCRRYSTWDEAAQGHRETVRAALDGTLDGG